MGSGKSLLIASIVKELVGAAPFPQDREGGVVEAIS
jgi:hypothetical protein